MFAHVISQRQAWRVNAQSYQSQTQLSIAIGIVLACASVQGHAANNQSYAELPVVIEDELPQVIDERPKNPRVVDESKLADKEVKIAVQVNGKLRGQFIAAVDANKDDLQNAALNVENVKKYTTGKNIVKIIVVPNKIVNIVAN